MARNDVINDADEKATDGVNEAASLRTSTLRTADGRLSYSSLWWTMQANPAQTNYLDCTEQENCHMSSLPQCSIIVFSI